jgi:DNA-binding helix-hairpin-helix protein with protein kinase domain
MLGAGSTLTTISGRRLTLGESFPPGGQGQVFRVLGELSVVKLYHPQLVAGGKRALQKRRLITLVGQPSLSPAFVWPLDVIDVDDYLGYVMPLVPNEFKSLLSLNWKDEVSAANLRTRLRICYRLVEAFKRLSLRQGYAYCDISSKNVLCHLDTGEIKIIDNDNLTVFGLKSPLGVLGTYRFIAPELESGKSTEPNVESDLHSMAVLVFETLLLHHPLLGDRVLDGPPEREQEALGDRAMYIYARGSASNRYTKYREYGGIPIWAIPRDLQDILEETFTDGLHDPGRRVRWTRWQRVLLNELDSLVRCSSASCPWKYTYLSDENIGHMANLKCRWCESRVVPPCILRFTDQKGRSIRHKAVYGGEVLAAHHCKLDAEFDMSPGRACAEVEQFEGFGLALRNVSKESFLYYQPGETTPLSFPPEKRVSLKPGYRVQFGGQGTWAEVVF